MKNAIRYSKDHMRLKTGEYQKADGSYEYRYAVFGRSFSFYSKTLENLREKEAQITSQQNEFRKTHLGRTLTLDSLFDLWRQLYRLRIFEPIRQSSDYEYAEQGTKKDHAGLQRSDPF